MFQTKAVLKNISELGSDYFLLELNCPDIAKSALPGHFVNIRVTGVPSVILRRPLAVFDVSGNVLKLFMKVAGKGTKWISQCRQGTEFDISTGPAAGPWGDPLRYPYTPGHNERAISIMRTCYVHIAEVDPNVPAPFKGVSWFGYGSPDSTYITPLWPIMKELPDFYQIGSRFEPFRRDSGWWVNTYTQEMVQLKYCDAIKDVYALRDPKLKSLYAIVPQIQRTAAELYKSDPEAGIQLISDFAYNTAVGWHKDWEQLGNVLLQKYWSLNTRKGVPDWFNKLCEDWANENMPRINKRLEK